MSDKEEAVVTACGLLLAEKNDIKTNTLTGQRNDGHKREQGLSVGP